MSSTISTLVCACYIRVKFHKNWHQCVDVNSNNHHIKQDSSFNIFLVSYILCATEVWKMWVRVTCKISLRGICSHLDIKIDEYDDSMVSDMTINSFMWNKSVSAALEFVLVIW